MNVLAILKLLESYYEKVVYTFFETKAKHTSKDNCDRKSGEKMLEFVFYMILWKAKLFRVGFVQLDQREPNLYGSESDMSTVHAQ